MNKNKIFGGLFALSLGVVALASCNNAQPATTLYTVKFVSDGTCVSKQKLEAGATITAPESPKDYETDKAKYTFNGWYDNNDGSKKFEPGATATKDVTYEAKFDENIKDYLVTFVYDDEFSTSINKKYGDKVYPSDVDEPDPYVKDHFNYEFDAWYSEGVSLGEDGDTVLGEKEYVAEYNRGEPVEYTAKFYVDGKYVKEADKVVTATKLLCAQPKFKYRDGYRYTWTDETGDVVYATADGDEDFKYARFDVKKLPDEKCDFNVYLKEEALVCTVNFWDKAGDTDPVYTVDVSVGQTVKAPKIECEDWYVGTWENPNLPGDHFDSEEEYTFTAEDIVPELNYVKTLTEKVNTVTFSKGQGTPETREFQHSSLTITAPKCDDPTPGYAKNVWYDETNNITIESEGTYKFTDADVTKTFAFVQTGVGNKYTVTLNANGGTIAGGASTVNVTFGKEYELPSVTPKTGFDGYKFAGWYDAEDNLVTSTGTGVWDIPSDTTLNAKWEIKLDGDTVPTNIISNTSSNVTLSMVEDPLAPSNGKVLKASYNQSGGDQGININEDYIKDMLGQENSVGIAFDATFAFTSDNPNHLRSHSNFRSHIRLYRYDQSKDVDTNSAYENSSDGWGLSADAWKTFVFKKEYYAKREAMTTAFKFIICGSVDETQGGYKTFDLYIRNIHPIIQMPDKYNFENGGVVINSGNYSFRSAGHNDNRFEDFEAPVEVLTCTNAGSGITSMRIDNSQKTKGNSSLKAVKTNSSYVAFFLPGLYNTLSADGYVDVDIRSTIAVNSTTAVKNFIDGSNNCLYPVGQEWMKGSYVHPANQWVTYRFTKKDNMINDSNRFLILQGSSGGDWWIDNVRVNPTGE